MKRYIAFRLTFAHIFECAIANYNLARESKIVVEYVTGNAVELISAPNEGDLEIIESLMIVHEGQWADELPPPTQFRNPMPDVVGNCNSKGWKQLFKEPKRKVA